MLAQGAAFLLLVLGATAQPSPGTCSLSIAGQAYSFQGCSPAADANSQFQLFYTVSPGTNGGAVLRGGLKAAAEGGSSGWAGLGLGSSQMVGSNAVIVKADPSASTGATVAGYLLESTKTSAVNDAQGSWKITDTAAALEDGSLVAVFSATLPGSTAQLSSAPFPYIWATGPTSSAGALCKHRNKGDGTLSLTAA